MNIEEIKEAIKEQKPGATVIAKNDEFVTYKSTVIDRAIPNVIHFDVPLKIVFDKKFKLEEDAVKMIEYLRTVEPKIKRATHLFVKLEQKQIDEFNEANKQIEHIHDIIIQIDNERYEIKFDQLEQFKMK